MVSENVITGEQLGMLFEGGLASIAERQQEIDRLNIFPVPDGDTGRNMYLTMQAAVQELKQVKTLSMGNISEALAKGSLMGARGNSGVILSQLIRGFSDVVRGSDEITLVQFAKAWQAAVATAYQAVMKPVEGTMLTVAKGFSLGLAESAKTASDFSELLSSAIQKGDETLQQTPELLPVLKKAGVVDAGGKGFLVIFEGGLRAIAEGSGHRLENAANSVMSASGHEGCSSPRQSVAGGAPDSAVTDDPGASHASYISHRELLSGCEETSAEHLVSCSRVMGMKAESQEDFTYEVELLLRSDPACLDQLRLNLQEYGGSIVIGNVADTIRVHVHTNQPGHVLNYCLQLGTLHGIQITNLRDQCEKLHCNTVQNLDLSSGVGECDVEPGIGVIAVAAGEGIGDIFHSLGARQIVTGGQTMNPPVEDFIRAIEAMSNEQILILPNNKNLIMAAEQAGKLVSRNVAVLPTTSVQAGISALLAFNPLVDMTTNIEKMGHAADSVKAGEVTYAVRDVILNNNEIKEGALIGLWRGDIAAVGTSLEQVTLATVDRMLDEGDELVMLLTGEEVLPQETDRVVSLIRDKHPQIEVEIQYGGQPVYYFLIGIE